MHSRTLGGLLTVAVLTLAGAACAVEQTEEARAPSVDLDVEPGQLPEYDINWADVDVGTTERTVTVPVVRVEREQREVSVPYIDINVPGSSDREERTIAMELEVPDAAHSLEISEIRAGRDTLWVIGTLEDTGEPASQAVTRVSDQVVINAPEDLDVRKIVVGERPEGVYNQQYRFVDSAAALGQQIPSDARVIYQRAS